MLHTSNKTSVRGFTLIKLLVVIAIIGLLSTIIAAPIQNARKKARDAKKIAELKSLQLAIEQFGESNDGNYPPTLSQLSPAYMPLLPTFTSATTSSPRDAYAYVTYVASSTGSADQRFSFHIGSKLEVYGPALDTDRDCVLGLLSSELLTPFCAVYNGDSMFSNVDNTGSLITTTTEALGGVAVQAAMKAAVDLIVSANNASTSVGTDFVAWGDGATTTDSRDEDTESTCKKITDCVFDITSQQ